MVVGFVEDRGGSGNHFAQAVSAVEVVGKPTQDAIFFDHAPQSGKISRCIWVAAVGQRDIQGIVDKILCGAKEMLAINCRHLRRIYHLSIARGGRIRIHHR